MTIAGLRFSSHIRFVTVPEWRSLHSGPLKNAYAAGSGPDWEAKDADQFVLQPKTFTDSVARCIAGGMTGNLKNNTLLIPFHAGIFHLQPVANIQPLFKKIIERRITHNKQELLQPLGGLVCGGQDITFSQILAVFMVGLLTTHLGRKPSYFLEQDFHSCTQVGYDGQSDTWYINVDAIDERPLYTANDLKRLFKKRYVSPEDSVYLGLTSTEPLPKEAIDSD